MKNKFVVKRLDILTRKVYPREDLIRFVKVNDSYILDPTYKIKGRGYYMLKDKNELTKAYNNKKYSKFFANINFEELIKRILN